MDRGLERRLSAYGVHILLEKWREASEQAFHYNLEIVPNIKYAVTGKSFPCRVWYNQTRLGQ